MSGLQEEVIRVWEATCATTTYAQDVAAPWERVVTFIKEVEVWVILAEKEAQERVLKLEAESATSMASTHGEAIIPRFRKRQAEASKHVPRMFKSHIWSTVR
jgi:hypothetical protein